MYFSLLVVFLIVLYMVRLDRDVPRTMHLGAVPLCNNPGEAHVYQKTEPQAIPTRFMPLHAGIEPPIYAATLIGYHSLSCSHVMLLKHLPTYAFPLCMPMNL